MLGECTNLARDLVNTPGSDMTPAILAQKAAAQAELCGVKYEILNEYDIEKLGMGSFLAVARGSANPPRLIVLRYQGDPESDSTVALVGKGITFDTGRLRRQGRREHGHHEVGYGRRRRCDRGAAGHCAIGHQGRCSPPW